MSIESNKTVTVRQEGGGNGYELKLHRPPEDAPAQVSIRTLGVQFTPAKVPADDFKQAIEQLMSDG